MRFVRQIYHLMRADFLERIRRFSFLVVIGLALFAGYMFVPPRGAPYTSFVVASHRGFYNSPWVGTLFGVTAAISLSLIGFYLVKNSISRDYDTRVGQIIATTPLRKLIYMAGKWLSNVLVLAAILVIFTVIAPVMQLVRGEVSQIDIMALWAPIWLLGLPALIFAAALAILFESVALLRGGFGNIVYFFIWGPVLVGSSARASIAGSKPTNMFDFAGVARIVFDIKEQLTAAGLDTSKGISGLIGPVDGNTVIRFMWDGIQWTPNMIMERLLWVGLAIMVIMIAAILFNRFDPARNGTLSGGWGIMARISRKREGRIGTKAETGEESIYERKLITTGKPAVGLTPVGKDGPRIPLLSIVRAELLLMLKGRAWWWYLCALGLIVATPFVPDDRVAHVLYAAAWLWPILIWSEMGTREIKHQTYQTVFSTPHPMWRQLPAILLAGVTVALMMATGLAIRLLIAGDIQRLYAIAIGALFVPSLALALGVWTNGSRTFEIVYLILWYISIQGGAIAFDYRGATIEAISASVPFYYFIIAIFLTVLAVFGRWKQMRFY